MATRMMSSAQNTILHLGLGSFHRAHQAYYFQQLRDAGVSGWSLISGNIRPGMEDTIAALASQGGAYTLETVAPSGARGYARIGSIERVMPYEPGSAAIVAIGASSRTRAVSFTVTEAGYYIDADGKLDARHPEIARDVELSTRGIAGETLYSVLVAILRARMSTGAGKLTLLSCDNLRSNGHRSRSGLRQFIEATGDRALLRWMDDSTTSPSTMVDRITPRPTPAVRERVRIAFGIDDKAPVMAESFCQWVVEDDFCNGRPPFEGVGVEMISDVTPYEEAKIRVLNTSHGAVAWGGALMGKLYIHDSVAVPAIRDIVNRYVTDDVIPCLTPSPVNLEVYRDTVLERFANSAIADTVQRVMADSFSKIRTYIAPTVGERLAANADIASVARLPALFLLFLDAWHQSRLPAPYEDRPAELARARAICAADDPIAALCRDRSLWGTGAADPRLEDAVRQAYAELRPLFAPA